MHSWSHGTIVIGVTQKGAHIPIWCPDFYGCCQGTLLHRPALVASGAYTRGSHRIVTSGERVLKYLPPLPWPSKRQQTQELSLSVKEAY